MAEIVAIASYNCVDRSKMVEIGCHPVETICAHGLYIYLRDKKEKAKKKIKSS